MSLFKKKKDIEEIELSEKHVGLRWTLVAVFLAVGLICIAVFLFSLLGEEEGWQTIAPTDKSFMPVDLNFSGSNQFFALAPRGNAVICHKFLKSNFRICHTLLFFPKNSFALPVAVHHLRCEAELTQ